MSDSTNPATSTHIVEVDQHNAEPAPARQGLWSAVRESLRGSHHDYTEGSVGRIVLLAIPMVLEMVMESVFVVVDIFWVGHLGADAVATVGLTESMLTLIYAMAIGLGIGATAMVARRIGEHNPDGAARAAVQAIALGVIISVAISIAGYLLAPRLLAAMGGSKKGCRTGRWLYTHHVSWQCLDRPALLNQCNFSRRGRCSHCDASAMASERDQYRAWSMFHFWAWSISRTG